MPEQKIPLADALSAYTAGAAYAEFQEREKGRLVPGQLADLVVLVEDVFALPAERLKDVRVETTIVGGKVVYEAGR
ncbi:MAG TPA: amidohydrolase family protein [Vicinamibacteria bacterium]|nr:amidohydrolase family protein [Vicinamibacteria bacterium]